MKTQKERIKNKYHLYLFARTARRYIQEIAEKYGEIIFGEGAKSKLNPSTGNIIVTNPKHEDEEQEMFTISAWEMINDIICIKEEEMEEKAS